VFEAAKDTKFPTFYIEHHDIDVIYAEFRQPRIAASQSCLSYEQLMVRRCE